MLHVSCLITIFWNVVMEERFVCEIKSTAGLPRLRDSIVSQAFTPPPPPPPPTPHTLDLNSSAFTHSLTADNHETGY